MILKQGDEVQVTEGEYAGMYGKFLCSEYGKVQFDKAMHPKFVCIVLIHGYGKRKIWAQWLHIMSDAPASSTAPVRDYGYSSMFNKKVHTVQSFLAEQEKKVQPED